MPDPQRLLRTLQQATRLIRQAPGRRGRVVYANDASEILVVGDLHGQVEHVRPLLNRAALSAHPGRHLVLQELIHGPYRYAGDGDKSHQLVDLLAALVCQYPRQVHCLLGNHELAQWTEQEVAKEADADLNALFQAGITTAYGSQAEEVYAAYVQLFASLPLALRTPNRIFLSHSLPSAAKLEHFDPAVLERKEYADEDLRPGGSVHALVWGRDTRVATAAAFLQKVDADLLITGHIPCLGGFEAPNDRQLILDASRTPAGYCLFPTDRPLSHAELLACTHTL
jgi:hypothetical protein